MTTRTLHGIGAAVLLAAATASHAASAFKPLFDGRTLAGWRAIGKGTWQIEDGAIRGTHSRWEGQYGHLITDRSYTNFIVRLKFKSLRGNSGFYFRTEAQKSGDLSGFQAEIDPEDEVGGLYESGGRGWVVKPKAAQVREWNRPKAWNEMTIEANGPRVTVHVNGRKTAELPNDLRGRREGRFALQLHGRQQVDVWFKDLEIAELK